MDARNIVLLVKKHSVTLPIATLAPKSKCRRSQWDYTTVWEQWLI